MSADLDDAGDRAVDRWRDDLTDRRSEWIAPAEWGIHAPKLYGLQEVAAVFGVSLAGPEVCDLCHRDLPTTAPGDVCPPDCPELDPECTVPACSDGSHRTCETEEARGMAERLAQDEAVLDRRAEWAEDDRRCGL